MNYGLGLVVWQMFRALRDNRTGLLGNTQNDSDLYAVFTERTACTVPNIKKPFTANDLPNLGPLAGETDMEPLNRCLCLLAHLKYVTSPSQWKTRYTGTWDKSSQITEDWIPDWMRADANKPILPQELADEFSTNAVPPREVRVTWRQKSKDARNVEFVTSVGPDGSDELDNITKSAFVTLEHSMSGPEARDRIRKSFKLDIFGGQIHELTLHIKPREEDDSELHPALTPDWEPIRKLIWEHDTRDERLRFTLLLCCRADNEICWESDGPPIAPQPFIQVQQGEVVPRQALAEQETKPEKKKPRDGKRKNDDEDASKPQKRCRAGNT